LFISAACLALTIGINAFLLENKNASRWALLTYFVVFFLFNFSQGAGYIFPYFAEQELAHGTSTPNAVCVGIGNLKSIIETKDKMVRPRYENFSFHIRSCISLSVYYDIQLVSCNKL